jgi:hypothetical protein
VRSSVRRFTVGHGTRTVKFHFPRKSPGDRGPTVALPPRPYRVAPEALPLGRAENFFFSSCAPEAYGRSGYASYASVTAAASRLKIIFFFPRTPTLGPGRSGRPVPGKPSAYRARAVKFHFPRKSPGDRGPTVALPPRPYRVARGALPLGRVENFFPPPAVRAPTVGRGTGRTRRSRRPSRD